MAVANSLGKSALLHYDVFSDPNAVSRSITSAKDGTSIDNLGDLQEATVWSPASTADQTYFVDLGDGTGGTTGPINPTYLAFINHNFGTKGVKFTVQGSDDAIVWNPSRGPFGFANDYPYVSTFEPGLSPAPRRYWRLIFTDIPDTDIFIGQIRFCEATVFPQGPEIGFDPNVEIPRFRSGPRETGFFIEEPTGDNVLRTVRFNYQWLPGSFLNDTTIRTGFRYWWENVGKKGLPTLFHWNAGTPGFFRSDAVLGSVVSDVSENLNGLVNSDYYGISFTVRGKAYPKFCEVVIWHAAPLFAGMISIDVTA